MSNSKQRISKPVEQILELCADSGAVIVSYGLAPNPNGFCFERGDDTTDAQAKRLSKLLEGLSERDERALRRLIFGGRDE